MPRCCTASSRTRIAAASYGRQFRGAAGDSRHADDARCCANTTGPRSASSAPTTACGCTTLRRMSDAQTHVRVTNVALPAGLRHPDDAEMTITQWHVPVDDTGCYWYSIFTSFGAPVDKETMREQRLRTYPAARLQARSWPPQRLGLRRRRAAERRPSPAWATTSTSTTSGPSRAGPHRRPHAREPRHDRQGHRGLPAPAA